MQLSMSLDPTWLITSSHHRKSASWLIFNLQWRNMREAVQASGIPTTSSDDDWAVRDKLYIAIWAAETLRTSAHVRALASDVQHCVLTALGAEPTWAPPLQDAYIDSVLRLCKACPWAADPSLSYGLLSTALLDALAFMQAHSIPSLEQETKARLQSELSTEELRNFETVLRDMGRSFRDVSWTGAKWEISPGDVQ